MNTNSVNDGIECWENLDLKEYATLMLYIFPAVHRNSLKVKPVKQIKLISGAEK